MWMRPRKARRTRSTSSTCASGSSSKNSSRSSSNTPQRLQLIVDRSLRPSGDFEKRGRLSYAGLFYFYFTIAPKGLDLMYFISVHFSPYSDGRLYFLSAP